MKFRYCLLALAVAMTMKLLLWLFYPDAPSYESFMFTILIYFITVTDLRNQLK